MNQKAKRILNAFLSATVAAAGVLVLEHYADLTNAVQVADWASLKTLGIAVLFGAVNAGIRAIQTSSLPLPSPEPEENLPPQP